MRKQIFLTVVLNTRGGWGVSCLVHHLPLLTDYSSISYHAFSSWIFLTSTWYFNLYLILMICLVYVEIDTGSINMINHSEHKSTVGAVPFQVCQFVWFINILSLPRFIHFATSPFLLRLLMWGWVLSIHASGIYLYRCVHEVYSYVHGWLIPITSTNWSQRPIPSTACCPELIWLIHVQYVTRPGDQYTRVGLYTLWTIFFWQAHLNSAPLHAATSVLGVILWQVQLLILLNSFLQL